MCDFIFSKKLTICIELFYSWQWHHAHEKICK